MGKPILVKVEVEPVDATRLVAFHPFTSAPSWYERHWLTDRGKRTSRVRSIGGQIAGVCKALATGTAFALERYGPAPLSDEESEARDGRTLY